VKLPDFAAKSLIKAGEDGKTAHLRPLFVSLTALSREIRKKMTIFARKE
jgi:hypothetical protein